MSSKNHCRSRPIKKSSSSNLENEEEPQSHEPQNFYEKIYEMANTAASTNLGQYAIGKVERVLSVIEKTAKWSLPRQPENDKGIPPPPLERPCSWIPFLTLIVVLRIARAGLSLGSILIGEEAISPDLLIKFIQTRRRKLRSIKYHGLRAIRMKQQSEGERKKRGVLGKLSTLIDMAICRPGRRHYAKSASKSNKRKITSEGEPSGSQNPQKRPLSSDSESDENFEDNLPVDQMLDKYGNKDSDAADSDYNPSRSEESSSSASVCDESEEEILEMDNKITNPDYADKNQSELKNNQSESVDPKVSENKNETNEKTIETVEEKVDDHQDNVTSAVLNPAMMSPNIAAAQNGTNSNSTQSTNENFYESLNVCEAEKILQGSPVDNHLDELLQFRPNNVLLTEPEFTIEDFMKREGFNSLGFQPMPQEYEFPRDNIEIIQKVEKMNNSTDDSKNITENHVQDNDSTSKNQHQNKNHKHHSNSTNRQPHFKYNKGKKNH